MISRVTFLPSVSPPLGALVPRGGDILAVLLLCGLTAGQVKVGDPWEFEKRRLCVDSNEGCAVVDVDRDGRLDLVAGRNWYRGPTFVSRPLRAIDEMPPDYAHANGDHIHDVDGDDWPDVVSGSFTRPEVYWFRNPGAEALAKGRLWKGQLLLKAGTANEITFLRDLDRDGKPEWIVNSWNPRAPLRTWSLDSDVNTAPTARRIGPANGHGMGFGDVNGDGRTDVVFQGGWYEQPRASATAAASWPLHRDFELPGAGCPIFVVDVNGDGRNDLLWGRGHDFGLHWDEQLVPVNGKTLWKRHLIDRSWSQAHALLLTDLDGDGRDEVVTGKRVRAHSGNDPGGKDRPCLYAYTFDATGRFTRHAIDEGKVGTGLQIRAGDLDGDGRTDLAMAGKDGTWVLFNRMKR